MRTLFTMTLALALFGCSKEPASAVAPNGQTASPPAASTPAPVSLKGKLSAEQRKSLDYWVDMFSKYKDKDWAKVDGKRCPEALSVGGEILRKLGPNEYEWTIQYKERRLCPPPAGQLVGQGTCPHFILRTTKADFSSKGAFQICLRRDYDITEVTGKDGFAHLVPVWTEDPNL